MLSFSSLRRGFALFCALALAGAVLAEVPHKAAPSRPTPKSRPSCRPRRTARGRASIRPRRARCTWTAITSASTARPKARCCSSAAAIPGACCATARSRWPAGFLLLATPLLILGVYLGVGAGAPDPARNGPAASSASTAGSAGCTGPPRSASWCWRSPAWSILFGKNVLLPWMGHDVFSWVAIISKVIHNFVGPLFIVCSIVMFVTFVRKNFFRRWDWQWIKHAGGLLSHKRDPGRLLQRRRKDLVLGRRGGARAAHVGHRAGPRLRQFRPDPLPAADRQLPAPGRRHAVHGRRDGPYLPRHGRHAGRLRGDARMARSTPTGPRSTTSSGTTR